MKLRSYTLLICVFFFCALMWSQEQKNILLYIDDKPIYSDEFVRLFHKNKEVVNEESYDLEEYLKLFITYQLKLAEAKLLELNKEEEYQKDINKYKKDQALEYLQQSEITQEILEEMYQRSLKEIHASHILINLPAYAFGKDTIKAYEKISNLRKRVIEGENINLLAKEFSDEPSAKDSNGDLGFFGSQRMVMEFEDAAYSTPIGEVSQVFRTGFGYHFLKVHDERPSTAKLRAAHILIMKSKDSVFDKEQIQSAYSYLKKGEPFEEVVNKYSQDAATKNKGGQLEPFDRIDIKIPEFIETAYNLKEGQISEPFESQLGWHIIKLIEYLPQPSKKETIENLKDFFNSRGNTKYLEQKQYDYLLSIFKMELLEKNFTEDLLTHIDREYMMKKVDPINLSQAENKELLKIDDTVYTYNDFLDYIADQKKYVAQGNRDIQLLISFLDGFKRKTILDKYTDLLYKENMEFATTIEEYNNGVLLYDLMLKEVWEYATKDSVGQKDYFEKHKSEFILPDRWKIVRFIVDDQTIAEEIQEKLNSNVSLNEIEQEYKIKFIRQTLSSKHNDMEIMPENINEVYTLQNDNKFEVVKAIEFLPKMERNFDEARNDVIQAYQAAYEKEWTKNLFKKHRVKLEKKRWRKLKSEIQ